VTGTAALLLITHVVLAWLLRTPGITTGQDDAVYLLLARGLRELSYSNYWLLDAPPQAQYPPLYPALLAIVGGVTGDRLGFLIAFNTLLSAAALWIWFRIARHSSAELALAALAVAALNPSLIDLAGRIATEPLFMLTTALALWWTHGGKGARARVSAGVAAVAAMLSRVLGVAGLAALTANWLLERRYRAAAGMLLISALSVGAWGAWVLAAPRGVPGQSYVADLGSPVPPEEPALPRPLPAPPPPAPDPQPRAPADESGPSRVESPPEEPSFLSVLIQRIQRNTLVYLTQSLPTGLGLATIPGTTLDNWAWLIGLSVPAIAGLRELFRRLRAAALLMTGYGALLLLWPYAIERYLTPLVPLLVLTLFLGARRLAPARYLAGATLLLGLLLGGSALLANVRSLAAAASCERSDPYRTPGCYDPDEIAFFNAAFDADRAAAPGEPLLTPKSATVYYLTGRRSLEVYQTIRLDSRSLGALLQDAGVNTIILSKIHYDQRLLAREVYDFCADWELVREYDDRALLLRRNAPGRQTGSCAAITRLLESPWRG
jgi:hypothetical protein